MKKRLQKIKWEELAPLEGMYYFSDRKKQEEWTKKAWAILAKEGLTKYTEDNGSEKIKILARYVALCILRYQFSEIINDENNITQENDFDYSNFVEDFSKYGVTSSDFGYLMAHEKEWGYDTEAPGSQESSALSFYVNTYSRKEVITVLKHCLGGTTEIYTFFCQILNDCSSNNMAFGWIDNGFCL